MTMHGPGSLSTGNDKREKGCQRAKKAMDALIRGSVVLSTNSALPVRDMDLVFSLKSFVRGVALAERIRDFGRVGA